MSARAVEPGMSDEPRSGLGRFKRILLKVSGEALMGSQNYGIDLEAADRIAREIS